MFLSQTHLYPQNPNHPSQQLIELLSIQNNSHYIRKKVKHTKMNFTTNKRSNKKIEFNKYIVTKTHLKKFKLVKNINTK